MNPHHASTPSAPRPRLRFSLWQLLTGLLLATILAAGPAGAQTFGYTFWNQDLHLLDLRRDSQPILAERVGEVGIRGLQAAALGPDGLLYVAAEELPQTRRLSTVDPQTLEVELIGDFGLATFVDVDLTFDPAGRLWMVTGGALFEVDPATGQSTLIADSLGLVTLAVRDGGLFALARMDPDGWSLVSLDPTTGEATVLAEAVAFESFLDGLEILGPAAMGFDDAGDLWVTVPYGLPMGDPPAFATSIYYFADPLSGVPASRSPVTGIDQSILLSLAVTGGAAGVTEIPTLGGLGLAVLALLLLGLGASLVWTSFFELVETGSTVEHWSRFVAMSFFLSSAFILLARCLEPSSPISSAENSAKTIVRLLKSKSLKAFAMAKTAAVPVALSLAPFAILSPLTSLPKPIWS